jgi:16S rRNA (cytosine967-C5)-methyltransferase
VTAAAARTIALAVLQEVERTRGFSNRILRAHLDGRGDLDPRERGRCTTLVYGVLRHQARLDALIDAVADAPGRLRGAPRQILRLSAFEVRELARPEAIVASQAIELARTLRGGAHLAGLMTAIVKGIAREGAAIDAAHDAAAPLDALERRWSIPRWLGGRWLARHGADRALARARALSVAPWVDLRVDLSRAGREEAAQALRDRHPQAEIELPEGRPECIRTRGAGDLTRDPLVQAGRCSVQGLGSQQAARLLDPQPGQRILDAGAGMGGKTLHLAERMQRRGEIVALDADPARLRRLDAIRERGGIAGSDLHLSTRVAALPGADLDLGARFDGILLDAPCTGLGDLCRHPERRWTARFADVAERSAVQRALLADLLPRLAPGGRLVYAVCSLEPEEGPEVVADVVTRLSARRVSEESLSPEEHGCDGFYLALLSLD